MSHPADLLNRALAADPARPLVTFYNDILGERVELSAKTFDNWVAKTANLLVDGLGVAPGDRVALALPLHWQHAVWLLACWSAGAVVVPSPGAIPDDVEVAVAGPDRLADILDAPEPVGLSLHALGAPLADCPPGVLDYAVDVRAYGDRFGSAPVDPDAPALETTEGVFSGAELCDFPVGPAERVLTTVGFVTVAHIRAGLLAPLASGGSVVMCHNLDESLLARRIDLERVTVVIRNGS
jgi:uncharacterized protein (TIGR03089 family)